MRATVSPADTRAPLAEAQAAFRARLAALNAPELLENFHGRIALVLSGGGGRGAYEAGALHAFQDAGLPTHIITASSVGSINAASYVAHSDRLVGNADRLVKIWLDVTPPAAGIEWTRYVWMLAGLVAASAGFGNLLRVALVGQGYVFALPDPALTWVSLGLAGAAVLLLYDQLPYVGYVLRNFLWRTSWQPHRRKALLSLLANVIVWGFLLLTLQSIQAHQMLLAYARARPGTTALAVAVIVVALALGYFARARVNLVLHKLLRLPLRPGLFQNFERGRLLRRGVPEGSLEASPIRVIFTATDLKTGAACFFSNARADQLLADSGVDPHFVAQEVVNPPDLLRAIVASSALPIAFEPIPLGGRLYTDGSIVANQPIRPAVRLGADVLFLVLTESGRKDRAEARTFVDVGLRALEILLLQNLLTDLKLLDTVNAMCEQAAARRGLQPEEVEVELGPRHYRYVKPFTIRPRAPLIGTVLDFGRRTIAPALLQGYSDAADQIEAFLAYAPGARFRRPRHPVRFADAVASGA